MQMKHLPYEVLFRFDETGALVGSHVQWRHIVLDENGNKVAEAIENAKPVAVGETEGFPLADILSEVERAAILLAEARTAELAALQERHAETVQALERAQAQVARLGDYAGLDSSGSRSEAG